MAKKFNKRNNKHNKRNNKSNNDQINPPRNWKNFDELKFRVGNFSSTATIHDVEQAFSTHCNVHSVKIEETNSEESIACIIIK